MGRVIAWTEGQATTGISTTCWPTPTWDSAQATKRIDVGWCQRVKRAPAHYGIFYHSTSIFAVSPSKLIVPLKLSDGSTKLLVCTALMNSLTRTVLYQALNM